MAVATNQHPWGVIRPRARPLRLFAAGWTLFVVATVLALQGCAARPYRPPPAEPVLGHDLAAASRNGRSADEGLIPPSRRSRSAAARAEIVAVARGMVGAASPSVNGRTFRADCSGYVEAVFAAAGADLVAVSAPPGLNGVAIIHRYVQSNGTLHGRSPRPGDLVFFDGTHGPKGRPLTHIGIVERVEGDGTVVFLHHMGGRVVRGRLNRDFSDRHRDEATGEVLNDYLRRGNKGRRLAGELFAAYGSLSL